MVVDRARSAAIPPKFIETSRNSTSTSPGAGSNSGAGDSERTRRGGVRRILGSRGAGATASSSLGVTAGAETFSTTSGVGATDVTGDSTGTSTGTINGDATMGASIGIAGGD